jgi:WD40 repeat protein
MLFLTPIFGVAQSLQTVIQKGHELAVVAVAVSPDSNFVATGSKDKSVKLWDIETGREIRSFLGHELAVSSVKFSPDGNFLISGSHDKTARIWDIITGKEVFVFETHDIIVDVAFDPKKRFIVVVGYNRSGVQDSATIYDYKTRQKIKRLPVNADEGRGFGISLAISNDGKFLAFGEDNRLVNVYKTKDWSKTFTFQYEEGWCGGCATMTAFSPNSESLYMA